MTAIVLLSAVAAAAPSVAPAAAPVAMTCPVPRLPAELVSALDGAERAWSAADEGVFRTTFAFAESIAHCVGVPMSPALVARYDRVSALAAFFAHDEARGRSFCLAAQRLDPRYVFPDALFPPGHPVHGMCETAPASVATALPAPQKGWHLYVDGSEGGGRSASLPTFLQVVDDSGAVRSNTSLLPADSPPCYPRRGARAKAPVAIVAVASAVGSAALLGAAFAAEANAARSTDYAALKASQSTSNAFEGAGYGLGAVAIGAGAAEVGLQLWSPTCR